MNEADIKKKGYLKCDLYSFESECLNKIQFSTEWGFSCVKTKQEMEDIIRSFTNRFNLILKAGAGFICFIEDGEELWYDSMGYVEEVDKKWADKYLRDVVEI